MSEKSYNFAAIANTLYSNPMEIQKTMKNLYMNKKVELKEFQSAYEGAVKHKREKYKTSASSTTTISSPTITQFEQAFKVLEEYPNSLQKIKKPAVAKTASRLNATIFRGSTTSLNTEPIFVEPKEPLKAAVISTIDVKEVLNDFKMFQARLTETKMLNDESNKLAQDLEKQMLKLHTFNRDVNNLCPDEEQANDAFTAQEEENLFQFAQNANKLRFLLQNDNIFQGSGEKRALNDSELQQYSNILNNSLAAVNNFKLD